MCVVCAGHTCHDVVLFIFSIPLLLFRFGTLSQTLLHYQQPKIIKKLKRKNYEIFDFFLIGKYMSIEIEYLSIELRFLLWLYKKNNTLHNAYNHISSLYS